VLDIHNSRFDVIDSVSGRAPPDCLDHLGRYISGNHLSTWADKLGRRERRLTAPAGEIQDSLAGR